MNWVLRAIKNNTISFLLILTVVIGLCYNIALEGEVIPIYKTKNWDGSKGFNSHWDLWIILLYVKVTMIVVSTWLSRSEIDKDVSKAYAFFVLYSLGCYQYYGWPEPYKVTILGFALMVILLIGLRIWNYQK